MADKQINLLINAILKDKRFRDGVKGMTQATEKAAKKQESIFKRLKAGWLAIAGAVYGVVRAFKAMLTIAADFEQSVANVASVKLNDFLEYHSAM